MIKPYSKVTLFFAFFICLLIVYFSMPVVLDYTAMHTFEEFNGTIELKTNYIIYPGVYKDTKQEYFIHNETLYKIDHSAENRFFYKKCGYFDNSKLSGYFDYGRNKTIIFYLKREIC